MSGPLGPAPRRARLLRALGVSRVARVAGLDRTGVEVACAVRPRGHVLQVTNGKGETAEAAEAGAVLEAAELWASERVDPSQLVWGSQRELRARLADEVWGADALGSAGGLVAPGLWSAETRLAWRVGVELTREVPVLVPAQALHCPPQGSPPLGPALVRWTTNGMGAHPERDAALAHALLEACERDQLARALPQGWTEEAIAQRLLDPTRLSRAAPRAARLAQSLEAGFQLFLFDLSPARGLGLPVAGALLFDRWRGPVPLTAGYACALDADAALAGALLEAAQSRLTDIHGAREDVSAAQAEAVERARAACLAVDPSREAAQMPSAKGEGPGALAARLGRVAAFELAPADLGLCVVKVVVPGMLVSELL